MLASALPPPLPPLSKNRIRMSVRGSPIFDTILDLLNGGRTPILTTLQEKQAYHQLCACAISFMRTQADVVWVEGLGHYAFAFCPGNDSAKKGAGFVLCAADEVSCKPYILGNHRKCRTLREYSQKVAAIVSGIPPNAPPGALYLHSMAYGGITKFQKTHFVAHLSELDTRNDVATATPEAAEATAVEPDTPNHISAVSTTTSVLPPVEGTSGRAALGSKRSRSLTPTATRDSSPQTLYRSFSVQPRSASRSRSRQPLHQGREGANSQPTGILGSYGLADMLDGLGYWSAFASAPSMSCGVDITAYFAMIVAIKTSPSSSVDVELFVGGEETISMLQEDCLMHPDGLDLSLALILLNFQLISTDEFRRAWCEETLLGYTVLSRASAIFLRLLPFPVGGYDGENYEGLLKYRGHLIVEELVPNHEGYVVPYQTVLNESKDFWSFATLTAKRHLLATLQFRSALLNSKL